jgi:hypothetical protein
MIGMKTLAVHKLRMEARKHAKPTLHQFGQFSIAQREIMRILKAKNGDKPTGDK